MSITGAKIFLSRVAARGVTCEAHIRRKRHQKIEIKRFSPVSNYSFTSLLRLQCSQSHTTYILQYMIQVGLYLGYLIILIYLTVPLA